MKSNKSKGLSVEAVVATGVGIAIVFLLKRFLPIPTGVPNTTIDLGEAFIAFLGAIFGPAVGGLVAFFAHLFNDLSWGDPWWTWIVADGIFGLIIGYSRNFLKLRTEPLTKKKLIQFNLLQIAGESLRRLVIFWYTHSPQEKSFSKELRRQSPMFYRSELSAPC